jgi:CRISPR-associated endonuclease/helicase Cas3
MASGEEFVPRHEDCWAKTTPKGKPGIRVRDHCVNVGCVAEALVRLLPSQLRGMLPESGAATLAALHDVGKVSPGFQVKSEAWLVQHGLRDQALTGGWTMRVSDHAKVSQFTVQSLLSSSHLGCWAAAVGAHHGRIKGERVHLSEPWESERLRLATELVGEFGALPEAPPIEAAVWYVAGLITVADWIGSDEGNFPQEAQWDLAERRRRAVAALAAVQWESVEARHLNGFADLFPELPQANSLQTATVEVVREPGVYVLEAPMGFGKTEAALAAAYELITSGKATGLYFALPTQMTSNRIHVRVQRFVDQISQDWKQVRLAHGSSWLAEDQPPAQLSPAVGNDEEAKDHVCAGRSWFASAKRALLAPFGVGTIDQALLGIVAAKHFFVRQFGLAGKVVILDEVHTYDLYTGTLIEALVKRLRVLGCTVIILSATLTEKRRRALLGLEEGQRVSADYPLVSGVSGSFMERSCEPPRTKAIQIRRVAGRLPIEDGLNRARAGGCVLWIRNTVDEAQETYRELQGANFEGGPSIALLHSRFPFFRREELESVWMERLGKEGSLRPSGCVLVSTQVAEQSVDIDADLLITDLAPTDMLLQRLGRLWRHERPARPCAQPEVWIQMPDSGGGSLGAARVEEIRKALGKSARVYAPYVLLRSLREWRERAVIELPGDIRAILEATYADATPDEPPAWRELREDLDEQKGKMARQALNATLIWSNPALQDEEGIQTRWNTYPTAQLLLARSITPTSKDCVRLNLLNGDSVTASGRQWNFDAAKAIWRNLVPVPRWALRGGLASPPGWLANHVTQSCAAGLVQPDGDIRWPGDERATGLAYDANHGIIIRRDLAARETPEESDESYD